MKNRAKSRVDLNSYFVLTSIIVIVKEPKSVILSQIRLESVNLQQRSLNHFLLKRT